MAYSNIRELPSEVRDSLDEKDCERWMEEYNKLSKDGDLDDAYRKAWRACMTLPSSFSFKIFATVEDVDSDGELITLDSVKRNMDSFIEEGGKAQQAHSNYQVATIWDYEDAVHPDNGKPGIVVYGNVFGGRGDNAEYAKAREDFIDGQNSLSIGADATVEGYECNDEQCYTRRDVTELMEISLCRTPANPYATLVWYNDKAVVKSRDDMTLKVESVDVHKSYSECTFERIRRMVEDAYPEATTRITRDGCRCSVPNETAFMKAMDSLNMRYDYDLAKSEFIVSSPAMEMERMFRKGMTEGWIEDRDGDFVIKDTIPATDMISMREGNLIRKSCNGTWHLNGDVLKEGGCMGAGTAGASNARYSDDKAYITFEEIMDWKSRLTKMYVNVESLNGDDFAEFMSIGEARRYVVEALRNQPELGGYALSDRNNHAIEMIYTDERYDREKASSDEIETLLPPEERIEFGEKRPGYIWNRRVSDVR